MKRGPFEVKDSKIVYKNPWIEVREDQVIRPNGKEGIFGTVSGASGSSIVILTKELDTYLVKEFHYATNTTNFELPSGAIDENETYLEAAKRELKEETGLEAREWTDLGMINPLTVVLNSPNHMFLAEGVSEGEVHDEEKDLIELVKMPFKEALAMMERGEITHGASVVAILKVARLKGF